jgi:hypothetical protein
VNRLLGRNSALNLPRGRVLSLAQSGQETIILERVNAKMPKLNEVFGISNSIPQYTYVDRSGLDTKFAYSLACDRHIVLHGGSKQGKTVLRRKNLSEASSIVVQCDAVALRDKIYHQILAHLDVSIPISSSTKSSTTGEGTGKAGFSVPLLGGVEASGKVAQSRETTETNQPLGNDANNIHYLADAIKKSGKRVVIEDFHYMPEEEKSKFAFDLKAFWDLGVFFIVVGIWAEHNLLTFYNADLSGRIDEIDVQWEETELHEV